MLMAFLMAISSPVYSAGLSALSLVTINQYFILKNNNLGLKPCILIWAVQQKSTGAHKPTHQI